MLPELKKHFPTRIQVHISCTGYPDFAKPRYKRTSEWDPITNVSVDFRRFSLSFFSLSVVLNILNSRKYRKSTPRGETRAAVMCKHIPAPWSFIYAASSNTWCALFWSDSCHCNNTAMMFFMNFCRVRTSKIWLPARSISKSKSDDMVFLCSLRITMRSCIRTHTHNNTYHILYELELTPPQILMRGTRFLITTQAYASMKRTTMTISTSLWRGLSCFFIAVMNMSATQKMILDCALRGEDPYFHSAVYRRPY